jgi:endonuclease YncB( thermonuclease family)
MAKIFHWRRPRRLWLRSFSWRETRLFATLLFLLTAMGLLALTWRGELGPEYLQVAATLALFALVARYGRMAWHLFANTVAVEPPRPILSPWVIDGDTVDDRAIGVRYRLANIDAPETGDNAKCFKENERGEAARRAAIALVRKAARVEVRRTWRVDYFGRRVAFVLVDGDDLGVELVKLGLARPWRGERGRWCGKNGGLAKIARSGAMQHSCLTCANWR